MLTQTYNIDMIPSGVPLALHISQYDVGLTTFVFTPYVSVGTMDFSVVTEAYLEATKPDMTAIVHACTVGNGTITYTVQEQLAAVSGRVYSKLVLKDASGDVVASKAILWLVEPAGVADDAILSDSDLSGVSQVIQASTNFNDAVPTQTVTDEVLTFDDAVEGAPLEDLKLHLEPSQNLNGYDYPWVGGAGKNLIDDTLRYTVTNQVCVGQSVSHTANQLTLLKAGTYTFSVTLASGVTANGYMRKQGVSSNIQLWSLGNTSASFTLDADTYCSFWLYNPNGITSAQVLTAQVESGSTATAYVPYSNICPISGYVAVNVTRAGNSLTAGAQWADGYYNDNGVVTSSANTQYVSNYVPVTPSTENIAQINITSAVIYSRIRVHEYDANHTWLRQVYISPTINSTDLFTATWTTSADAAYIRFSVPKNTYLAMYGNATTYPISLTAAGTVYGGTLDVTTGELVVDKFIVHLKDATWTANGSFSSTFNGDGAVFTGQKLEYDVLATNNIPYTSAYIPQTSTTVGTSIGGISLRRGATGCYVRDTRASSVSEFTALLASEDPTIVLYYATPLTYQLTPTEVTTLLGQNTIWMDAEGTIDASYKVRLSSYFMALRTMLAPVEATYTATANYAVGDYLIVGTVLYKVTAAITSGETIAEGSNVTATTVMAEIKALQ